LQYAAGGGRIKVSSLPPVPSPVGDKAGAQIRQVAKPYKKLMIF
jgi:hypothetical protein